MAARRFQYSLRSLLLMFIPVAWITALTSWLLRPAPINLVLTVSSEALRRYDDGAGHSPLCVSVTATNRATTKVWVYPGYALCQLVGDKWEHVMTYTGPGELGTKSEYWSALRGEEATSLVAGAISEEATHFFVAMPCTTDRFCPKVHWVCSPIMQVIRKTDDRFAEVSTSLRLVKKGDTFLVESTTAAERPRQQHQECR